MLCQSPANVLSVFQAIFAIVLCTGYCVEVASRACYPWWYRVWQERDPDVDVDFDWPRQGRRWQRAHSYPSWDPRCQEILRVYPDTDVDSWRGRRWEREQSFADIPESLASRELRFAFGKREQRRDPMRFHGSRVWVSWAPWQRSEAGGSCEVRQEESGKKTSQRSLKWGNPKSHEQIKNILPSTQKQQI